MTTFKLGIDHLTTALLEQILVGEVHLEIDQIAATKIRQSKSYVDDIVDREEVVYGINTGFGPLCTTIISAADTQRLQENILRSHSVGVGEAVPIRVARTMMVTKLHSLCQGGAAANSLALRASLYAVCADTGFGGCLWRSGTSCPFVSAIDWLRQTA